MAPMSRENGEWPAQKQDDGSTADVSVDTQYANPEGKNNSQAFGAEPWLYCRDATNAYLSARYCIRDAFLSHLEKNDAISAERIKHEIDRISKARHKFEKASHKNGLIQQLKTSRQAWKAHWIQQKTISAYGKSIFPAKRRESQHSTTRELARHGLGRPTMVLQHEDEPQPKPNPESDFGFKACAMYFKLKGDGTGWEGYKHPDKRLNGAFPNQKVRARLLLDKDSDSLLRKGGEENIRYFHFPSNNMSWVEQAIARYYDEEDIVHDDYKPISQMTQAEKLLRREFWRGQMHGQMHGTRGTTPLHARHMRARCSLIPRADPERGVESTASSSRGAKPEKNVALFLPYLHWETDSRRAKMVEAIQEASPNTNTRTGTNNKKRVEDVVIDHRRQRFARKTLLGEYLVSLAKVADAMDYFEDEELLKHYLHTDSPLHVRRTLDQYRFSTLDETSARDRDQVVYRETRSQGTHSRTRVVMVDQLWLWILDDKTIIMSFPRRWGRNTPDPSGVHKSLRERLENDPEIKSIHHLALTIIDQCSRVFFDRTRPLDQRPEVIDLFNSAIWRVTEHTTIAFDSFWRNTALKSSATHINRNSKHLDINPEGTLLQESRDLVEELRIMQHVFNQQFQVVKDFRRHLGFLRGDFEQRPENLLGLLQAGLKDLPSQPSLNGNLDLGNGAKLSIPSSMKRHLLDDTVQEADVQLELIQSRQAEIQDLTESALHTCNQLERLLSLKQQQASIVEAKAALERASESVKQGRAIMAFTLVTIVFLPLGFFVGFFGMNNKTSTGDEWMTIQQQVTYMFSLSTLVILISVLLAFSPWFRERKDDYLKKLDKKREEKDKRRTKNTDDLKAKNDQHRTEHTSIGTSLLSVVRKRTRAETQENGLISPV